MQIEGNEEFLMTIRNWGWVQKHGRRDNGAIWICAQTKSPLCLRMIKRSLHLRGLPGGMGEVELVGHVYCPDCSSEAEFPKKGPVAARAGLLVWGLPKGGNSTYDFIEIVL